MQLWVCLLLLAQSQPFDPMQALPLQRRLELAPAAPHPMVMASAKPKVCSIPLINVIPPKGGMNDKITAKVPGAPRAELRPHTGDYVTLPAPPCDDMKQ